MNAGRYGELVARIASCLGTGWGLSISRAGGRYCVYLERGGWKFLYACSAIGWEDACMIIIDKWFVKPKNRWNIKAVLDLVSDSVSELELKLTLRGA